MNDEPQNLHDLAQALIDTTPDSRLRDRCIDLQQAIGEFTAGNMEGWTLQEVRMWNVLTTQQRVILTLYQRLDALEQAVIAGRGHDHT